MRLAACRRWLRAARFPSSRASGSSMRTGAPAALIMSQQRVTPAAAAVRSSTTAAAASYAAATTALQTEKLQQELQETESGFSSWRSALAAALVGAAGALLYNKEQYENTTQCNGIVAIVGASDDAREFLLDGLDVLRHRGYDSAGMATISQDGILAITKYADREPDDAIDLVAKHSPTSQTIGASRIGLAHTRWATHGGKTDANAHPHTDASGKIAIVHNGTINNSSELRKELIAAKGYKFEGTTDSEVLAKLIGHYYEQAKANESGPGLVKLAVEYALSRCDGSWGLCVMCTDTPDELIVACNGSPMLLGVADDKTLVASETAALGRYTKNFIAMKDGEIGVIHATKRTFDLTRSQRVPLDEPQLYIHKPPEPFPHWTLKEIYEQPEAIARALGFGGRLAADKIALGGLDKNVDRLSNVNYVTLTGCGTSINAARYGERIMKQLESFERVASIDSTEFEENDLPCPNNLEKTGLIVVSQSGETKSSANVVEQAIAKGITTISVVNTVGSLIARTVHLGVYCNAGRENGVTSTKGFTTQVVSLALIALWFRQTRDLLEGRRNSVDAMRLKEALMRLPISFGMALKLRDQCREVAKRLDPKHHCFVLGKGYAEPVAIEGALKIKEMGYLHAEGCSGGALKHGPFALIESDQTGRFGATPIILLILDDQHAHLMRTCGEETKARGADLIVITDKASLAKGLDDNPIVIPNNGPLTALGAILPLQLIAYELAVLRGNNPDMPRNLSKVFSS